MSAPSTLDDLLRAYRAARDRGEPVTPQELCRDRPELLAELLRRLEPAEATEIPKTLPSDPAAPAVTCVDSRVPAAELCPDAEPLPGYRLVRRLGKGGYGEVWEALAPGGFHVAFKFVSLEGRAGEVELQALEIIRNLRHPNLLTVFGTWQQDGRLLIGMELADATLHDELKKAAERGQAGLPGKSLARWTLEAARVIDYLNKPRHFVAGAKPVGIQHGDIKPQNILLIGKGVKVGDFGLVRLLRAKIERYEGGMTPLYAAPEVLEGRVSRWSDQYSLAVTWCQLRGGGFPFTGGSFNEVCRKQREQPPDLSMLPEEERPAVARALASDPRRRWPDCRAFVKALAECRARPAGSAKSAPPTDAPRARTTRRPMLAAPPPAAAETTLRTSLPRAATDAAGRVKGRTLVQAAVLTLMIAVAAGIGLVLTTSRGTHSAPDQRQAKARLASPPKNDLPVSTGPAEYGEKHLAHEKRKADNESSPDTGDSPPKLRSFPTVPLAERPASPVRVPEVTAPPAHPKPRPAESHAREDAPIVTASPMKPKVQPTAPPEVEARPSGPPPGEKLPTPAAPSQPPSAEPAKPPEVPGPSSPPAVEPVTLAVAAGAIALVLAIALLVVRALRRTRETPPVPPDETRTEAAGAPSEVTEDRIYRGHADAVWSLALTPDGRYALSGGMDHTVRLWDIHTLRDLYSVEDLADGVTAVTLPAGDRLCAYAGLDGTVRLGPLGGGDGDRCSTGHQGRVFGLTSAPDGRTLASCGEDGTVRVWDIETGGEVRCLRGHAGWVYAVAYAGDRLVSAGADGSVRLWDPASGAELRRLEGHTGAVRCLGVSPDGGRAATGGEDRTVIVWDLESGRPLRRLDGHTDWVRAAAWTPDGLRLVTGGDDETLCVWDPATGEAVKRFEDTGGSTLCLAVTPNGRSVLAGGDDASVRIWELPV